MPKFVIKDATPTKEEPPVELWLERSADAIGAVYLKAKKGDGAPWFMITFRSDGTIERQSSFPASYGIPVDATGRVVVK